MCFPKIFDVPYARTQEAKLKYDEFRREVVPHVGLDPDAPRVSIAHKSVSRTQQPQARGAIEL